MKRLQKRTIHDVSTYVMKKFKRPCRECAIVVICTTFLTVSSLSAGPAALEPVKVDAAGKSNAAPAVLGISEAAEEYDAALNESGAAPEQLFEASGDFEALGAFEAYETLQLLKSVKTLTAEASDNERSEAPAKEAEALRAEETHPETADDLLSEGQPEEITVASAESAQSAGTEETGAGRQEEALQTDSGLPESIDLPGGEASAASAAAVVDAAALLSDGEAVLNTQEQPSTEEININSAEDAAADCEAALAETDICGLSASEYDALCRIVEAEAGTEGEEGKLLVANVVLNRVADPAFPSTIEGVITADGQFSPVQNGRYQRAVATPETLAAVNRALNGENISKGALYFKSVHSTANWGNRTLLYNYRNHNFYQ